MKKTLNEIKHKISNVAESLRQDAGYSGAHSDFGATELEEKLAMFIAGVKACTDAYISTHNKILSGDTEFEVPSRWEKYFLEDDKEYKEYLRLKDKFKHVK